jgi:hypothetical protein
MATLDVILKPETVYVAHDRFVCASLQCAGVTAAMTGVTTGGAKLREVDAADVVEWQGYEMGALTCECGAVTAGVFNDEEDGGGLR